MKLKIEGNPTLGEMLDFKHRLESKGFSVRYLVEDKVFMLEVK